MSRTDVATIAPSMDAFDVGSLEQSVKARGAKYLEFLRVPAMSAGVYRIPKGGKDPQSPHAEDEIYYVVRGSARLRVGVEDRNVAAGAIVFVPARVAHRFHEIEEDLIALVVFAPAEGAPAP